jgi:uncharacterized protein
LRFWDSSAIVPLLLDEPFAARVLGLLERDEIVVVWWATPIECWSAIARARRDERIEAETEDRALKLLEILQQSWYEVAPSEEVRRQSRRLLRIHPLRAADALQLAAAIVWSGHRDDSEFVSFDARLRDAARREGFALP